MKWLPSFNFWMKVTILWRKLNIGCAQPMWRFRLSSEVGARPRAIWLGGSACPGVIGRMGTFKSVPCEIYTGASTFGGISGRGASSSTSTFALRRLQRVAVEKYWWADRLHSSADTLQCVVPRCRSY